MKRLIVNADDLGADESRNAGIFEAIEAGAVTSASVLVNGPAFGEALRRIRSSPKTGVSFGIHINLSEGRPLSSGLRLLVGADGHFRGKAQTQRMLRQRGDAALEEEIFRETTAQVEALAKTGVPVIHLDGHQHLHVFPAVIGIAIRAAEAFGIPWMRIPAEPPRELPYNRSLEREARMFSQLADEALPRAAVSGVKAPDRFVGLYLKGRLTPSLLMGELEHLPEGLSELMVHPGRAPVGEPRGPFASFSTRDREAELLVLTGRKFREALSDHAVCLTPFPEDRA